MMKQLRLLTNGRDIMHEEGIDSTLHTKIITHATKNRAVLLKKYGKKKKK